MSQVGGEVDRIEERGSLEDRQREIRRATFESEPNWINSKNKRPW